MRENPNCPRCGQLEDLNHKFISCEYISRIWSVTLQVTDTLKNNPNANVNDPLVNRIIGAAIDTHPIILTIHSEIISRILRLKDDDNFLLRPSVILNQAIRHIKMCEKMNETKIICDDLLERLHRN